MGARLGGGGRWFKVKMMGGAQILKIKNESKHIIKGFVIKGPSLTIKLAV